MNKRDQNKMYTWERERKFGKGIYALINAALTVITLYVLCGALNFAKIINIWFLAFDKSYPFLLPAFAVMYIVFLLHYSNAEEEYQQLLKYKKSENESHQSDKTSIE